MYRPNSLWSWSFVGIAALQALIVLAFEAYVFATFQQDLDPAAEGYQQSRTIPTFLALYIFGFLYQLVLVWDALRLKNTIQILGLVLYNVGLLIYGSVQIQQIHQAISILDSKNVTKVQTDIWSDDIPFLIAIPCVLGVATILMGFVAWKLYDEFAWTIYKHISADRKIRSRYLTYQIYIALLKFDFFFFLGFTVQFVVIITGGRTQTEFALTIAAIPMTIIILFLAAFFTRRENLPGMIGVIILFFGGLAYFLFKMVRMYSASHGLYYDGARKELSSFAVITIILIILTIVNACVCAHNFGKGLKPYVATQKVQSQEEKGDYPTELVGGPSDSNFGPPPRRISID